MITDDFFEIYRVILFVGHAYLMLFCRSYSNVAYKSKNFWKIYIIYQNNDVVCIKIFIISTRYI